MVLETVFETAEGCVALIDFMPMDRTNSSVIRIVEGRRGKVAMRLHMMLRFDYGRTVPWVTQLDDGTGLSAIAGPNRVVLRSPVELSGQDLATVAEFSVAKGRTRAVRDDVRTVASAATGENGLAGGARENGGFWRAWLAQCRYDGRWREPVLRSLLTLKALTYSATGGIVAAPTTSLPEQLGGSRNWDYRFCWLRDATMTLMALMSTGLFKEALAWRDWLLRCIAGSPAQIQIMYGLAGERQLVEWEAPWLPGYHGSAPVRIGNAASDQLQLDVYGELIDALYQGRKQLPSRCRPAGRYR